MSVSRYMYKFKWTGGKNFRYKMSASRNGPEKITETRTGWKDKKTILLQKSCGKERLSDYSTSVAWLNFCMRSRVVFQSFFTTTFLWQYSLLVFFIPSLFLYCFQTHLYLHLILTEKFLPLVHVFFFGCSAANSWRGTLVPLLVILIIHVAKMINQKDTATCRVARQLCSYETMHHWH